MTDKIVAKGLNWEHCQDFHFVGVPIWHPLLFGRWLKKATRQEATRQPGNGAGMAAAIRLSKSGGGKVAALGGNEASRQRGITVILTR